MPRVSQYIKNFQEQDPNEQLDPKNGHGVRFPNDFVDWNDPSLHGEVKVQHWTKEEVRAYEESNRKKHSRR
jgi:hypothetical protein